MGFKLVRTDSQEPLKIILKVGTHVFGRGNFLNCDDKRVSRNHGEIHVTNDSLTIKALHQNPCFYTKRQTKDMRILRRNHSVDLGNGDKFGLLPDSYWYEIIHCATDFPSPADVTNRCDQLIDTRQELMTQPLNLNESDNGRAESPSLLNGRESPSFTQNQCGNESPSIIQNTNVDMQESTQSDDTTLLPTTPVLKRRLSEEVVGSKRIKTEPVEVKQEPPDEVGEAASGEGESGQSTSSKQEIKKEPQVKEETLNEPSTSGNQDTAIAVMPGNLTTLSLPRERCMYGHSCYRKNPQHLSQYSHPADGDWGSGPRAACPWGPRCRRRDPRHWRDHDHPARTIPPTATRGKKTVKKRSESQSDDEDLNILIITGKRQRKNITMQDWSDSEQEDPFGTDDSDEWDPGSEEENSQSQGFTQDF